MNINSELYIQSKFQTKYDYEYRVYSSEQIINRTDLIPIIIDNINTQEFNLILFFKEVRWVEFVERYSSEVYYINKYNDTWINLIPFIQNYLIPDINQLAGEVYEKYKHDDGFLYLFTK